MRKLKTKQRNWSVSLSGWPKVNLPVSDNPLLYLRERPGTPRPQPITAQRLVLLVLCANGPSMPAAIVTSLFLKQCWGTEACKDQSGSCLSSPSQIQITSTHAKKGRELQSAAVPVHFLDKVWSKPRQFPVRPQSHAFTPQTRGQEVKAVAAGDTAAQSIPLLNREEGLDPRTGSNTNTRLCLQRLVFLQKCSGGLDLDRTWRKQHEGIKSHQTLSNLKDFYEP